MIVLDASVAVELVLGTRRGRRIADRIASPDESLSAPHLIDLEVVQVLRRYVRTAQVRPDRADAAVQHLRDLDLLRQPHEPLLDRIWALRGNMSAYDAAYVALAEALGAVLLTCDARLARAPGSVASIEVVD